jgi:hypothetical protein
MSSRRQNVQNAGTELKSLWVKSNIVEADKNLRLALFYEMLWHIYTNSGICRNRLAGEITRLIERAKVEFQVQSTEVSNESAKK